jgi:predicted negative regulator of RcsB-dependent stress response
MQLYWTIFCLCTLITSPVWTQDQIDNSEVRKLRGEINARDFGIENVLIERLLNEAKFERVKVLKEAKFFLVNGETELARGALHKLMRRDQDELQPVVLRYLALADFQDGKWKSALKILSTPELNQYPQYASICGLKIITRIAIEDTFEINQEWEKCKAQNSKELISRDTVWMDTLVSLMEKKSNFSAKNLVESRKIKNLDPDQLRPFLKLIMFMNLEEKILSELEVLDYESIQDEELRVIIAQIYFRRGKFATAWKLMEDISNPNVENMKGNLWVLRGNQELAYAQFKLALKQKANSHNAIERALPLAWSLEQWSDGLNLTERIYVHEKNRLQKLTTSAVFAVRLEKWDEAQKNLEQVYQVKGEDSALETNQLSTYVALQKNDRKGLNKYSLQSCYSGDMIACWIMTTNLIWEDLPILLKRDEEVFSKEPLWKVLSEAESAAFKEPTFIDQKDIDELDDELIQLIN